MAIKFLDIFYTRSLSLVELMIISVIVAILGTIIGQNFFGMDDDAKQSKVYQNIRSLEGALNMYKKDVGFYPRTEETLNLLLKNTAHTNWNGPYIKPRLIVDPWGRHYVYELIDEDHYRIFSLGKR